MLKRVATVIGSLFYEQLFNPVYKGRLARYIAQLCGRNVKVLDVGCNEGYVAHMVMQLNPTAKIVGIDIQANRPALIERKLYDGRKIPFPDNHFDVVIALDVLHHTESPAALLSLLKEMRRVSKKYIIIKDHIARGIFSRWALCLCDILANLPFSVKCTFNYATETQWEHYFKAAGLRLAEQSRRLYFGFGLTERYNPVFKLEKISSAQKV